MAFPFLVIEGIDGTGKSTVVSMLSEELSGIAFQTTISDSSGYLKRYRDHPEARFLFYLSHLCLISEEIKQERENRPVICDRYIFSTLSYHKAMGVDIQIFDRTKSSILLPDKIVVLTADDETLIKRIAKRDGPTEIEIFKAQLPFLRSVEANLKTYADLIIDTSALMPGEIVRVMCRS